MGIRATEEEIADFLRGVTVKSVKRFVEPISELDPNILEEEFQSKILALAKANNWKSYHTRDSRRSTAGFPDCVFVRGSCLFMAELKRQTGKVSDDQELWIDAIKKTPVVVYVWRPSDWPEIIKILTAKET